MHIMVMDAFTRTAGPLGQLRSVLGSIMTPAWYSMKELELIAPRLVRIMITASIKVSTAYDGASVFRPSLAMLASVVAVLGGVFSPHPIRHTLGKAQVALISSFLVSAHYVRPASTSFPPVEEDWLLPAYRPGCYTYSSNKRLHSVCHLADTCGAVKVVEKEGHWYSATTDSVCMPLYVGRLILHQHLYCGAMEVGIFRFYNERMQVDRSLTITRPAYDSLCNLRQMVHQGLTAGYYSNSSYKFLFPTEHDLLPLPKSRLCSYCLYYNTTHLVCNGSWAAHQATHGVRFVEHTDDNIVIQYTRSAFVWVVTAGLHIIGYILLELLHGIWAVFIDYVSIHPLLGRLLISSLLVAVLLRDREIVTITFYIVIYCALVLCVIPG